MVAGRPTTLRCVAFAIAVVLTLGTLFALAARPDWRSGFLPAQILVLPVATFKFVAGEGNVVAEGLRIEALGPRTTALEMSTLEQGFDAANLRLLRYQFAGFPHSLELSFVFRRADQANDVHAVSLPWPGRGVSIFDLGNVPDWSGRIVEVGFAQYPTPQSIPPGIDLEAFTLMDAQLESLSWRGAAGRLVTDWMGDWPWSQRSVHSLGRDATRPSDSSLLLYVALAVLLAIVWAFVLLGLRRRTLSVFVVGCCACAWLALDLLWQGNLSWRLEAARQAYADASLAQRTSRVADPEILDAANVVKQRIGSDVDATHVLVQSDSAYSLLRLIWHLQPMNTAVYSQALADGSMPARGNYVVVYDAQAFRRSAQFASLITHSRIVTAPGNPNPFTAINADPLVLQYMGAMERHRVHGGKP